MYVNSKAKDVFDAKKKKVMQNTKGRTYLICSYW